MRLTVTVGVIAALAALAMAFGGVAAAATITETVSTTCTFDPHFEVLDAPAAYSSVKTRCVTETRQTVLDDPVCISGVLWVFGNAFYGYVEYWYAGRAVLPDLDGVAVATDDPADIVIPGAHYVSGSAYQHAQPLGYPTGTC